MIWIVKQLCDSVPFIRVILYLKILFNFRCMLVLDIAEVIVIVDADYNDTQQDLGWVCHTQAIPVSELTVPPRSADQWRGEDETHRVE